jgi:dephospho-CoA kinase
MKRIGLTGNMGSGKSTVARVFENMGVPVFEADNAGRALLDSPDIKKLLLERWGDAILNPDQMGLNRKAIAAIVFADNHELAWLNALVHPKVREMFAAWCAEMEEYPVVAYEAAILFESGYHSFFNKTVVVSAPEALRVTRIMERDGAGRTETLLRMGRQWAEEKKTALADYVIVNDGQQALLPQVIEVLGQIFSAK